MLRTILGCSKRRLIPRDDLSMSYNLQDEDLSLLRVQATAAVERAKDVVSVSREIRKRRKLEKVFQSEPFNTLLKAVREERKQIPEKVVLEALLGGKGSNESGSSGASSR